MRNIMRGFLKLFMTDAQKLNLDRDVLENKLELALQKEEFNEETANIASELDYYKLSSTIYEKTGDMERAAEEASKDQNHKHASKLYEQCKEYYEAWHEEVKELEHYDLPGSPMKGRLKTLADLAIKNKDPRCINILANVHDKFPKKIVNNLIEDIIGLIQDKRKHKNERGLENFGEYIRYSGGFCKSLPLSFAKVLVKYNIPGKEKRLTEIVPYLGAQTANEFLSTVLVGLDEIDSWISKQLEETIYDKGRNKKRMIKNLSELIGRRDIHKKIITNYLKEDKLEKAAIVAGILPLSTKELMREYKRSGDLKLIKNLRSSLDGKKYLPKAKVEGFLK